VSEGWHTYTYTSFTTIDDHGCYWTTTALQSSRLVLNKLLQMPVEIRSTDQNVSVKIHHWPKTLIKQINKCVNITTAKVRVLSYTADPSKLLVCP
jgi:hypothetical protein